MPSNSHQRQAQPDLPCFGDLMAQKSARLHLVGLAKQFLIMGSMTKSAAWSKVEGIPDVPMPEEQN